MDGLLLVDKPVGWTSFDVVAKVRGVLKASGLPKPKVGHSGTLDPLASGLLVLLIGSYTKRAETLTKLDKTYQVVMCLGKTSTTGDGEGEVTSISDKQPSAYQLKTVFERFIGDINQVPPAYSAIKVDGQRAYKLVRQGKVPSLEARIVHIYMLQVGLYAYPEVHFSAKVGSGTYIRSLVEDIGNALKTGAYMSSLRREQVGSYSLHDAIKPEELRVGLIQQNLITG